MTYIMGCLPSNEYSCQKYSGLFMSGSAISDSEGVGSMVFSVLLLGFQQFFRISKKKLVCSTWTTMNVKIPPKATLDAIPGVLQLRRFSYRVFHEKCYFLIADLIG